MAHTFRTQGSGASQTLHEIEDEKIPVYDTKAEADADLANLAEGQIVATKDTSTDYESELYNYVDAKLATTTTEVAMDIFKTGSKAFLNKSGNNVQFRYLVTDPSTFNPVAGNTWVTIGTIPEGLRPIYTIYLAMQGIYGGNMGSVMIDGTTGNVQVYKFDTETFGWEFSIQCDYNIDGTNNNFMSVNTLKDAKDYTDAKIYEKIAGTVRVTDCDTMDVPGTYNYDPNTANTPDNFYGVLVVYGSSPDKTPSTNRRWIFQVATSTKGEVFRRQKNNPQSGGTWSAWTTDVMNKNITVTGPTTNPGSYRSQILYLLNNTDWSFLTNRSLQSATGRIEFSGYWWMQYTATHIGSGYMEITGTVDCENKPVTFSAYRDASIPQWYVTISNNFSTVLIPTPGNNIAYQLASMLNALAPQTWGVPHDEGIMELQGYFYANYTLDCRGSMYFIRGTTYSSDQNMNHQQFTAEFNTTNNTWVIHNVTIMGSATFTTDGNGNLYIGDLIGGDNAMREIIWVHSTNSTQDYKMDPMFNYYNQWWVHVSAFDTGLPIANTQIPVEVKYRVL